MHDVLAMILAGGKGERLSVLVSVRAKPAVPFAGRYRIIDFTLSNCVNSGIIKVAVVPQYNPRSLIRHIGVGKPWDLDRTIGGITLLHPYVSTNGEMHWYSGTADAIYQNLPFVESSDVSDTLILAGDHIYIMDYRKMIDLHRQKADITIAVTEVTWDEASRLGTVLLNEDDRVVDFEEKSPRPKSNIASMGIYAFKKETLAEVLTEAHSKGWQDFGKDILPRVKDKYRVYGYRFQGYWRDVGTIESYWRANMDLIADLPQFNLYDPKSRVRTVSSEMPPAKLGPKAQVGRSLISSGCIINGKVFNSVLSPSVYVEEGAEIIDSIVFEDTFIGRDARVFYSIVDKGCYIARECWIGYGNDYIPNIEEPGNLNRGINVVGKGAKLPPGLKIGRNCKIDCYVKEEDFSSLFVPSGSSIKKKL